MRSLVIASIAALSVSASSVVNHIGNVLSESGSGSWYLSLPKEERHLDQYLNYNYNYTNGTFINQTTEIVPDDGIKDDVVKFTWQWFVNGGYTGSYQSGPELWNSNIWNFQYLLSIFADAKLLFDVSIFNFYKASAVVKFDIIDGQALQEFRWIRPQALFKGAVTNFDLAIRPSIGLNKLLDLNLDLKDQMNANFAKDIAKSVVDVLGLGYNYITSPDSVDSDDTQNVFAYSDFGPVYPTDFSYGGAVGLIYDNFSFYPLRDLIRYLKDSTTWNFTVNRLFNYWLFQTRSD